MAKRTLDSFDGTIVWSVDRAGKVDADVAPPYRPFRDIAEAEATTVPSPGSGTLAIMVMGYANAGDVREPMLFTYIGSEPSHEGGKVSTNGGAVWWELANEQPTPKMFGAAWDWSGSPGTSTNDTVAIQNCIDFCRTKRRTCRFPAGEAYAAGTIYGGGVRIIGAGAPNNSEQGTSKTVIHSDGNPMLSHSRDAGTAQSFGLTQWEDFVLVAAGGSVSSVETWDTGSYPAQIGIWVGRNHNFIQTISGGENPTSGGSGGITIRRVNVEDASGWGVYGYKLWGKSVLSDMFFRRCGGEHAASVDNDRVSGMMRFDSLCVDFVVENCHGYGKGYANAAWDARGCGIRLGADKDTTDGFDREWERGNYQVFRRIHVEGYKVPYEMRASAATIVEDCSFNGNNTTDDGQIRIGRGKNPANDLRLVWANNRINHVNKFFIGGTSTIDLGKIIVADPNVPIEVRYWTGVAVDFVGLGQDFTGVYAPDITWTPEPDPTSQEGGIGSRPAYSYVPLVITDNLAASPFCNMLPDFSEWTGSGGGVQSVSAANGTRLSIRGGAERHYDFAGLDPDELYTLHVWAHFTGAGALQNVEYGTKNAAGDDLFRRAFGFGAVSEVIRYSAANVKPAGSGALRVFVTNSGGTDVDFVAPMLLPGAGRPLSLKPPSVLMTPDGAIPVDQPPAE